MNEYPISPANRIIGLLLATTLIVLGIFIINTSRTAVPSGQIPLMIMGAIFTLLGGWLVFGTSRLCVTVDDDMVRVRGALGNRELPLSEIDGYRMGNKDQFYLVRTNGKGFYIPGFISRHDELIKWVKAKYVDADVRERDAETRSILREERYGATEEERKAALQKARNLGWGLALPTIVFGILIIFEPVSVTLLCILCLLPLLGVFLTWRSNGLLRLSIRKGNPHPTLTFTMAAPPFMVGVCALAQFRFYGFSAHAWIFSLLTALGSVLLALTALRGTIALERLKTPPIIFILVIATIYGFGVAATSNCALDRGAPQAMVAIVAWKHIQHGKSTSYELTLAPWGRYTSGNTIEVSRSFFNSIRRSDTLHIALYPGKWGIPWYRLHKVHD